MVSNSGGHIVHKSHNTIPKRKKKNTERKWPGSYVSVAPEFTASSMELFLERRMFEKQTIPYSCKLVGGK